MIIMMLKAILFLCSFLGITMFIKNLFKIEVSFSPIVSIATISITVFLAGLLNCLVIANILLYVFGLGYIIYFILHTLPNPKKIPIEAIVCAVIICLLFFILFQAKLLHYDNYSHWANIVKNMLNLNSFPTQLNENTVTFITYPPGSACFIYYVCYFIGSTDGIMIFAQSMITFFSIMPLLSFISNKRIKKSILSYGLFLVAFIITFTINIQIRDLLVDTILATIGFSVTAIIYKYRSDYRNSLPVVILLMIFLCLIKNSGIFFVAGNIVLFLYYYVKNSQRNGKELCMILLTFLIPFIFIYLWKCHTNLCFTPEQLASAKHSLSISNYMNNLGALDGNAIHDITATFLTETINFDNLYIRTFVLIDILSLIYCVLFNKRFIKAMIALNFFYVIYMISLWGTYIFSMPYNEAIYLASYDRYYATFLLYFILILFAGFLNDSMEWKKIILIAMISMITGYYACAVTTLWSPSYEKIRYSDSGRDKVEDMLEPYEGKDLKDQKLLILLPDTLFVDGYYNYYIKYVLQTDNFTIIHDKSEVNDYNPEEYLLISE